jgi:hypothetical protein
LIIVSHQKRTMEAADALYGVTMAPGGSSKVVSQKVPRHRSDGLDWSDGETGTLPGSETGLAPAPSPEPETVPSPDQKTLPSLDLDTRPEATSEAISEVTSEATTEVTSETGSESIPEASLEAIPGARLEAPTEAPTEAPAEAPTAPGTTAGSFAEPMDDDILQNALRDGGVDERFDNAPIGDRYVDTRSEAEHVVGTDQ